MPAPTDLTEIIEDQITDAELPLEDPEVPEGELASDEPTEVVEPSTTADGITEPEKEEKPEEPAETVEVSSPASKKPEKAGADDFDKKYGIQQNSASGRENRIPYSRVKKIVTKAETTARDIVTKEWQPKFQELETKYKDFETKVKDYEGRLTKVGEFENEMLNNAPQFLVRLAQNIPAYAQLLAPLFNQQPQQAPTQETQGAPVAAGEAMPQPDQKLSDGSMVYSMEGLSKLMEWHGRQVESRVTKQVEARYAPMETQFQAHQRVQAVIPQVQAQIDAARKWEKFSENEGEIVKALQADQNLSLEGAYRQVVLPKLQASIAASAIDKTKLEQEIRERVIKELKQTPRSTSTAAGQTKARQQSSESGSGGARSLEDVISDAVKSLK